MNTLLQHFCQCPSRFDQCKSSNYANKRLEPLARNAFQSLSYEEKDKVYEDLYGIDERVEESPELIRKKLEELDREIDKLSPTVKEYYTRAIDEEKKHVEGGGDRYISTDAFRLMFLRADRFDAKQAAKRLTTNLTEKDKLFGRDKLACRITQADMSEEDKKALDSGALTFTGAVDRAGRPILLARRQHCLKQNIVSMMRALYYMIHSVLEANEDLQKKGVILIGYNMNEKSASINPSTARATLPLPRMGIYALPFWFAGIHICYDDMSEHVFTNLFLVIFPKHLRARFQGHYQKTHEECMFSLDAYGIDSEVLPFKSNGSYQNESWQSHLDALRQIEEKKS